MINQSTRKIFHTAFHSATGMVGGLVLIECFSTLPEHSPSHNHSNTSTLSNITLNMGTVSHLHSV